MSTAAASSVPVPPGTDVDTVDAGHLYWLDWLRYHIRDINWPGRHGYDHGIPRHLGSGAFPALVLTAAATYWCGQTWYPVRYFACLAGLQGERSSSPLANVPLCALIMYALFEAHTLAVRRCLGRLASHPISAATLRPAGFSLPATR